MPTPDHPRQPDDAARRARARRTAVVMALVAVGVYVAFLMLGVLGR
jgi:uncharacterized membrane protein